MIRYPRVNPLLLSLVMVVTAAASIFAHEETYKGTVVKVDGQKIEVQVIDDKTKKEAAMTFEVTSRTKVFRGDKEVKFADAKVQNAERIVVTVNHDVSATRATIIRLAATE